MNDYNNNNNNNKGIPHIIVINNNEYNNNNTLTVNKNNLLNLKNTNNYYIPIIRTGGNLKNHALLLSSLPLNYKWIIAEDDQYVQVLLPVKI
jgi:hypothetical protein